MGATGIARSGSAVAARARRFNATACKIWSLAAVLASGAIGGGVRAIGSSCDLGGDGHSTAGTGGSGEACRCTASKIRSLAAVASGAIGSGAELLVAAA